MEAKAIQVDCGCYSIAAKQWGDDTGYPVLALHGWLDNAASFDLLAPNLRGLNFVAVDLPGHGLSSHRHGDAFYYVWDYVKALIAVVDYFGWQNFALVGHSLGGAIATLLAGTFPDRVSHIVWIDTMMPLISEAKTAPEQLAKAIKHEQRLNNKSKTIYKNFDDMVKARMMGIGGLSEPASRILCERGVEEVAGGFSWRSDQRLTLTSPMRLSLNYAESFISRIEAQSCLIYGRQGLFIEYEKEGIKPLSMFKPDQVHKIPGGHHMHLEEQSPQVTEILQSFLSR